MSTEILSLEWVGWSLDLLCETQGDSSSPCCSVSHVSVHDLQVATVTWCISCAFHRGDHGSWVCAPDRLPLTSEGSGLGPWTGVPNLQDLMPERTWGRADGITIEIKCKMNVMHLNHPHTIPHPLPPSTEKLSSTKPIPGAKKIGDSCLRWSDSISVCPCCSFGLFVPFGKNQTQAGVSLINCFAVVTQWAGALPLSLTISQHLHPTPRPPTYHDTACSASTNDWKLWEWLIL